MTITEAGSLVKRDGISFQGDHREVTRRAGGLDGGCGSLSKSSPLPRAEQTVPRLRLGWIGLIISYHSVRTLNLKAAHRWRGTDRGPTGKHNA